MMMNRRHAAQPLSHLFPAANDNARRGLAAMVPYGAVEEIGHLRYDEGAAGRPANDDDTGEPASRMRRYLATTATILLTCFALATLLLSISFD